MNSYEWTFEVADLSEDMENTLDELEIDAFYTVESDVPSVTLVTQDTSAVAAGRCAVKTLREAGVVVVRTLEDLVSRGEIARRAGVTPQAVGNWLRGDRQIGTKPPRPYVRAGIDIWLWSEVCSWLDSLGVVVDLEVSFPSRLDHWRLNADLIRTSFPVAYEDMSWSKLFVGNISLNFSQMFKQVAVRNADNSAREFGLAA